MRFLSSGTLGLGLLLATACGGGDDEKPAPLKWQCYADTSLGECDCYVVEPGSSFEVDGSSITEVDDCSGYETCLSYIDEFFEEPTCSCGAAGYDPGPDAGDVRAATSCPDGREF